MREGASREVDRLHWRSRSAPIEAEQAREGGSRDADTPYWRIALQSADLERAEGGSGALSTSDLGRARAGAFPLDAVAGSYETGKRAAVRTAVAG